MENSIRTPKGIKDATSIICLESSNGHTLAHLKSNEQLLLDISLAHAEKLLPEDIFLRVSKGYIINLSEISEVLLVGDAAQATLTKRCHYQTQRKNHRLMAC